jgi:type II secretory pathway pseudopilin PulG
MAPYVANVGGCSRRRTGGYTLLQIIVVLLIIGVLAVAFGYGSLGKVDASKASAAKSILAGEVPKAFFSYLRTNGVPTTNTDVRSGLIDNGLSPQTPWHEDWSAKMVGNNPNAPIVGAMLRIRYPIGGDNATNYAQEIASSLIAAGDFPQVANAANPSNGVIYVYYKVSRGE